MLFTYPVAGAPDMVIALLVGMVLFVVNKADRVKNQMIVQMPSGFPDASQFVYLLCGQCWLAVL